MTIFLSFDHEDGVSKENWSFYLMDNTLYVNSYAVYLKAVPSKRKPTFVKQYTRITSDSRSLFPDQRVPENMVPLTTKVIEAAKQELLRQLKVAV